VLIFAVFIALVSSLAVSGLLVTQKVLSSSGSVKAINVEVYWDVECTQVVTSIDWGNPEPGDSLNRTIYVKNTGSAPMTLSMSCSGWSPVEAENYLTLTWDKEGAQVDAGVVVQAVLTLSVSESVSGFTDFSFNIVIEGSG
jgi:hypothetical protein